MDLNGENRAIKRSVVGESQTKLDKCNTGTCCVRPIRYTCSIVILMCLTALKETEPFCFPIEAKFVLLLRPTDFLSRNRIYIDIINHA